MRVVQFKDVPVGGVVTFDCGCRFTKLADRIRDPKNGAFFSSVHTRGFWCTYWGSRCQDWSKRCTGYSTAYMTTAYPDADIVDAWFGGDQVVQYDPLATALDDRFGAQ